ncbi:MAG: hypothetical protein NXI01_05805 [Gammaproteobacteria bacterium]|nr:hypothetical protein [Gammaproteobacteria bacterium]
MSITVIFPKPKVPFYFPIEGVPPPKSIANVWELDTTDFEGDEEKVREVIQAFLDDPTNDADCENLGADTFCLKARGEQKIFKTERFSVNILLDFFKIPVSELTVGAGRMGGP